MSPSGINQVESWRGHGSIFAVATQTIILEERIMKNIKRCALSLLAVLMLVMTCFTFTVSAAGDPTEEVGTQWVECGDWRMSGLHGRGSRM